MKQQAREMFDQIREEVLVSEDIAVFLDEHLNYVEVNRHACDQLGQAPEALIGKNILDLYPEITASQNHRNMLKALSGKTINYELIESRGKGTYFRCFYRPVMLNGEVKGVVVKASREIADQ